jgi:hypothetical protein
MIIPFDKAKWNQDPDGFWLSLRVNSPAQAKSFVSEMQNRPYDAELKQHREKRSLDANAYLWVLCQKISEVVKGTNKESVYQDAVKHSGQFEMLVFKDDAVETFIHRWAGHGLGWFAEKIDGNIPGYSQVIAYYGSSVYDTHEMSVLLDYVVNLAKDLEIQTATPDELERMKSLWGV